MDATLWFPDGRTDRTQARCGVPGWTFRRYSGGRGKKIIAQITDLHVGRPIEVEATSVDPRRCLERAVAHLNGLTPLPDIVLVTGDLTRDESAEDYAQAKTALAGFLKWNGTVVSVTPSAAYQYPLQLFESDDIEPPAGLVSGSLRPGWSRT